MSAVSDQPPSNADQRAVGSSFYAAMRIMPKAQREAMFEIYSFCRLVDDIADDGGPRDQRLNQLQRWRTDIDALYAGKAPPHLRGLAQAVLSAWWCIEDRGRGWEPAIAYAKALASIRP